MTAPLLFNNQRWEAGAHEEVSPWKIQVFATIKVQLAEMTGFEVERGGRTEEPVCWVSAWKRKKKSEPEDDCGPISPPGFWIINKDKEADYQVLTADFVWISLCLWRGSEALAGPALWRLWCWWEDSSGTPPRSHGRTEAARGQRLTVRGLGEAAERPVDSKHLQYQRAHTPFSAHSPPKRMWTWGEPNQI